MKLDRNENADRCGKYALINLRKLNAVAGHVGTFQRWHPEVEKALKTLEDLGVLEWGQVGSENEFFVTKLKDLFAPGGLRGYAHSAMPHDPEYSRQILEMADRAGPNSPWCKKPD